MDGQGLQNLELLTEPEMQTCELWENNVKCILFQHQGEILAWSAESRGQREQYQTLIRAQQKVLFCTSVILCRDIVNVHFYAAIFLFSRSSWQWVNTCIQEERLSPSGLGTCGTIESINSGLKFFSVPKRYWLLSPFRVSLALQQISGLIP